MRIANSKVAVTLFAAVLIMSASERPGTPKGPADSGSRPLKLQKIYFLFHPLTYAPECEASYKEKDFYRAARAVENEVRRRYQYALDRMLPNEALVIFPTLYPEEQFPKPEELVDLEEMAKRKLGQRLVICSYPTKSLEFVELARRQGLVYDPQTVETEAWGESFDGCVAKYASRFSKELGLAKPMEQNFAMCVPDFWWLLSAKLLEKVTLPSKVRFYLFETEKGELLATFYDSYFVPGDKARSVEIPLRVAEVEAYKYEYRYAPAPPRIEEIATPDGMRVRIPISNDFALPAPGRRAYLLGRNVDRKSFREALTRARVVE